MVLAPHSRLGEYEILAPLGAGGMGEVYRAADHTLGREVAVKVLPQEFARDPERLARFEREARLLASLNHPGIAAIHGLETSGDVRFLVLELVEGATLAHRLESGSVELDEALAICGQIAEALEAAHEKGIVHRDLKPANVKVTPDGKVKVLDFGLAKAFAEQASIDPTQSPTVTAATRAGTILGTAAYMSPEQARGRPLDRRTDVWSFGCVLYETLAGQRVFRAETVSDTLAAILKEEPNWAKLPAATPVPIRVLLKRCLEKDSHRRLRDMGDARLEIEDVQNGKGQMAPGLTAAPARRQWATLALIAVVIAAAAVLSAVYFGRRPSSNIAVARLAVPLAAGLDFNSFLPNLALSPDGTRLVYAGRTEGAAPRLYLRRIDQYDATPLPDTEGAYGPFFSPGGEWVAFFAGGKLKKVPLGGGTPVVICDAPSGRGGTWTSDGSIIFAARSTPGTGLSRVPGAGGTPETLTTPDHSKGERSHRWPEALHDRQAVIFTVESVIGDFTEAHIATLSLENRQIRVLLERAATARHLTANARGGGTGWLLAVREDGLVAARLDLERLELAGQPVSVGEPVATNWGSGAGQYAFSRTGGLVYQPSLDTGESTLVWVDRAGASTPVTPHRRAYVAHRISPDGKRIAAVVRNGDKRIIQIYDLERDTSTLLSHVHNARGGSLLWTPDGKRLVYEADSSGVTKLFWTAADASGPEEPLVTSGFSNRGGSWSLDGLRFAFAENHPNTGFDICLLSIDGDRRSQPIVATPLGETQPAISPDGRLMSYVTADSGNRYVYVQPFPGPGPRIQVSTESFPATRVGESLPGEANLLTAWAADGNDLFYFSGNKVMAVEIRNHPELGAGKPRVLFDRSDLRGSLDVAPDGRFVMMERPERKAAPAQINVVLNFDEDLNRRFGAGRK